MYQILHGCCFKEQYAKHIELDCMKSINYNYHQIYFSATTNEEAKDEETKEEEGEEQEGETEEGQGEEEDCGDQDVTNMELSWEMLELTTAICTRSV